MTLAPQNGCFGRPRAQTRRAPDHFGIHLTRSKIPKKAFIRGTINVPRIQALYLQGMVTPTGDTVIAARSSAFAALRPRPGMTKRGIGATVTRLLRLVFEEIDLDAHADRDPARPFQFDPYFNDVALRLA